MYKLILFCFLLQAIDAKRAQKQVYAPNDSDSSSVKTSNEVKTDRKTTERESEFQNEPKEETSNGNNLCQTMTKEGYEKCKQQYVEITKGEQNSRKICCALKTLQQCILPVLNKYCSLDAFNEIEKDLHGANHICRIVGSRYCPKVEGLDRLTLDPKEEFELI